MNCNLSNIGFIKVGKPDNSYRYIDIIQVLEGNDTLIEPYTFSYDYIQKDRTMFYSLPVEGMNNNETLNSITSLYNDLNKNKLLTKTNAFLPQISSDQSQINIDIASSVRSEDSENNTVNSNIFAMILPEESWIEIYETSLDVNDTYGENDYNNVTRVLERQQLDKIDFLRSLVIGITVDPTNWSYTQSIITQVEKPIKWFTDELAYDLKRVPSYNLKETLNNNLVILNSSGIKIGNRVIFNSPENLEEVDLITYNDLTDTF